MFMEAGVVLAFYYFFLKQLVEGSLQWKTRHFFFEAFFDCLDKNFGVSPLQLKESGSAPKSN